MGFRYLIGFFRNLFFYFEFSLEYSAESFILPPYPPELIIIIPAIASILVTWISNKFSPEIKGHGIPEVINVVYNRNHDMHSSSVVGKALSSSITIGSGGSAGREGPIVLICACIGNIVAKLLKMPNEQKKIFIAAGASAGIAATFNAPLGGTFFAIELLMLRVDAKTLTPILIATVTATYLSQTFLGLSPTFNLPEIQSTLAEQLKFPVIFSFLFLGLIIGVFSAAFIYTLYGLEEKFKIIKNQTLRHFVGMLIVGIILYTFFRLFSNFYVAGVGYATIVDILKGNQQGVFFLLLLAITKLLATSITIGSGGSGGIFAPSLYIGAALGASYGLLLDMLLPNIEIDIVIFCIAGMSGMVSGTTGAVFTAMVMGFDMTRNYNAILPAMICAGIANRVRMNLIEESIYTLKLAKRGIKISQGLASLSLHQYNKK